MKFQTLKWPIEECATDTFSTERRGKNKGKNDMNCTHWQRKDDDSGDELGAESAIE